MGIRVRLCSDWCLREADWRVRLSAKTSVSCIVRTQYPYFAQRYAGITGFGPILVLLFKFLFVFDIENHIHSSLVAAALILIIQTLIHDHLGHLHAYDTGTEGEDVGIVMLTGHSCAVWLAAGAELKRPLPCLLPDRCRCRFHRWQCRNLPRRMMHCAAYLLSICRVVTAFAGIGSEVDDLVALLLYICLDCFLHLHPRSGHFP